MIDDCRDTLELTRRYIVAALPDFDVLAFGNSAEALDFLWRERVDLIVTDYRMPLVDGLDLTGVVRTFDAAVPILVVSENDLEARALARGATAFAIKDALRSDARAVLDRLPGSARLFVSSAA